MFKEICKKRDVARRRGLLAVLIAAAVSLISAPASAQVVPINRCQAITQSGTYEVVNLGGGVLFPDFIFGTDAAGGTSIPCIDVEGASNVVIHCNGQVINGNPAIRVNGSTNVGFDNCKVRTFYPPADIGSPSEDILTVIDSDTVSFSSSAFGDSTLIQSQNMNVIQTRSFKVTTSTALAQLFLTYSTAATIQENSFTSPLGQNVGAGVIQASYGAFNTISGNNVDGLSLTRSRTSSISGDPNDPPAVGMDDAIILIDEHNDTLSNNNIKNVWDTGIEFLGNNDGMVLSGNGLHNVMFGIGGWFYASITNSTFSRNRLETGERMFFFERLCGLRAAGWDPNHVMPADTGVFFQNNVFTANNFTSPIKPNADFSNVNFGGTGGNVHSVLLWGSWVSRDADELHAPVDVRNRRFRRSRRAALRLSPRQEHVHGERLRQALRGPGIREQRAGRTDRGDRRRRKPVWHQPSDEPRRLSARLSLT
jgi:hypothetical protein